MLDRLYSFQASAFFLAARFGLAAVASNSTFTFFEAARFNRAFMACLFLETPYEFLQRFPFFDFLSPFPMIQYYGAIIAKGTISTKSRPDTSFRETSCHAW